jgi:hypothetical protein
MTAVDLDVAPPATTAAPRREPSRAWITAAVLGLIAAGLGGALVARPASAGVRPTFLLSAESNPGEVGVDPAAFVPTVTAWYADGTRGDAAEAITAPWRPDRPIRMLTLVAARSCSIEVDEVLAVVEQAATNRVAVCVWTAPA